jgi:hypothetical protein
MGPYGPTHVLAGGLKTRAFPVRSDNWIFQVHPLKQQFVQKSVLNDAEFQGWLFSALSLSPDATLALFYCQSWSYKI